MIELERHIEILLLENDCVIVPDFGGFMAHEVTARYDEADHSFLPPMRTLGFNPQLRINDSLLAQSYVSAHDISYPEALRRISDEVAELKRTLDDKGCYAMDNIGTLSVNEDGNYQFEPCEAGILSPAYYGLGAFAFRQLSDHVAEGQPIRNVATDIHPLADEDTRQPALLEFTDSEDRAIEIKMSWVRNAISIAAAIVAFFLIATPIANSEYGTQTMSQLQSSTLLFKLMPKDTTPVPTVVRKVQQPQPAAQKSEQPKPAVAQEQQTQQQGAYCIVLASQVRKSNAEAYVQQLHAQGYKDAQVYIHNNIVRVVYGAFETEAQAYRQLNKMRNNEQFEEAWVYKKSEV